MVLQPLVGQSLLFIETSQSRSDTPQSVGLLWVSDQPDPETSTWQHTTLKRDWHPFPSPGFEPTIPASERQQTHASDRKTTGISSVIFVVCLNIYTQFDLRGLTVNFLRLYSPFILATNWSRNISFLSLGAFAKQLRAVTTSLVQYAPLSAWNSATYTRGIFVNFHICDSD
jgi:hypothetical protein